jgi:hypothetical protein
MHDIGVPGNFLPAASLPYPYTGEAEVLGFASVSGSSGAPGGGILGASTSVRAES